jgi:glutaminyl-peptide cyclotransferase
MTLKLIAVFVFACGVFSCGAGNANSNNVSNATKKNVTAVPTYGFEIVNTFPHDPNAFTQGFIFHDGFFYESDGEYEESRLRKVELATGKTLQYYNLPREFFGEGMTLLNDKIYQVTWREKTCFVYDAKTFKLLKEFRYSGEGWGLTHDGVNLYLSDGTHVVRVINPETFETVNTIVVHDEKGQPIMELNELEYVKGELWANVWHKTKIARIEIKSGNLLGWIDLTNLAQGEVRDNDEHVLNGIAYDSANDRIFVTGKDWRKVYEIKLKER